MLAEISEPSNSVSTANGARQESCPRAAPATDPCRPCRAAARPRVPQSGHFAGFSVRKDLLVLIRCATSPAASTEYSTDSPWRLGIVGGRQPRPCDLIGPSTGYEQGPRGEVLVRPPRQSLPARSCATAGHSSSREGTVCGRRQPRRLVLHPPAAARLQRVAAECADTHTRAGGR